MTEPRTVPQQPPHPSTLVDDVDDLDDAPRPRRKGIYILPNLFTLAALFGGFYAIVMAMNGNSSKRPLASSAPWCSTAWTGESPA
jgi:hypothetical protein